MYPQPRQLNAIAAIKAALEAKDEPVAWMNDSTPSGIFARHIEGAKNFGCTVPLYTIPPQRTWVGLTDEDMYFLFPHGKSVWVQETVKIIEAKLRSKNHEI
jgi:hypothetical protein